MRVRGRPPSRRWASAADCWWPRPVRGAALPGAGRRLPGRRRWGVARKLELRGLIASIQAALAVSPVLLYKLHEVCDRCVLTKDRLQEGGFLVHSQSVLDQLDKPSQVLGVVAFEAKSLLEIPVVIEAKVLLHEAWPICIVQILLEGVKEEVNFVARAEQEPIFVDKVGKQRFAIANITYIIDCKDVQVFHVDLWIVILRRFVALLFCLFLLRLRPLGQQGLALVGVLPIRGQLAPLLQAFLPLSPCLLE
mmetsp:Transcript_75464/g.190834  ORF Transcript_75464/g.190834 Transcript_75464/m.190834 type:complete len:250 (-) Transcript_75464:275-1024(-)